MTYLRKQIADLAGINPETVRYYEKMGLIAPQGREPNGYRVYGEETLKKLDVVKTAKMLGLSLLEISNLLRILFAEEIDYDSINQFAVERMQEIDDRIQELQKIKTMLAAIKSNIDSNEICPLKSALKNFT